MTVDGNSITDEQIRELGHALVKLGLYTDAMWCDYALAPNDGTVSIPRGCERDKAREHCARIHNARSACEKAPPGVSHVYAPLDPVCIRCACKLPRLETHK